LPGHDITHGFDAIHNRHLDIHGYHVGLELQGFFHCIPTVNSGTNNLQCWRLLKNFGYTMAKKRRVIDYQNFDLSQHR
jgi:hypothetical protein